MLKDIKISCDKWGVVSGNHSIQKEIIVFNVNCTLILQKTSACNINKQLKLNGALYVCRWKNIFSKSHFYTAILYFFPDLTFSMWFLAFSLSYAYICAFRLTSVNFCLHIYKHCFPWVEHTMLSRCVITHYKT